jgi:hypothetical protein
MKMTAAVVGIGAMLAGTPALRAQEASDTSSPTVASREQHSLGHQLVMYIPNRVFDVLDIVRARVRIGPGIAVSARATELVDFYAGSYTSLWVGLHGPRLTPTLPLPVGTEALSGIEIAGASDVTEGPDAPVYGLAEVGVGVQAVLAGVDVGVSPVEVLDLVAGFLFFDITGDDL